MANTTVKTIGIVLIVIIGAMFFFRTTPFFLAPFGVVSNVFDRVETSLSNGPHFLSSGSLGFPLITLFSLLMLILWIVVIVWVYRDAERRNMNGVLWALLVFIGNLIGLLIYLIVRSDNPFPSEKKPGSYICSNCKNSIDPNHKFCPHCGESLNDICPGCKKPVKEEWKVCPNCGNKLK